MGGKTRDEEMEEFRAAIMGLDDDGLVDQASHYVWLSAYASNNARSIYHLKCDATHDEAKRRGKPWLYQRGWNDAYRTCGHEPSERDLALARPSHPSYAASVDERPQGQDPQGLGATPASAVGEAETPNG